MTPPPPPRLRKNRKTTYKVSIHRCAEQHTDISERQRQTDSQRQRQRQTDRQSETETETDRQRQRQRNRERQRQRDRKKPSLSLSLSTHTPTHPLFAARARSHSFAHSLVPFGSEEAKCPHLPTRPAVTQRPTFRHIFHVHAFC